ncbi:MAG: pyocin knob domain-containing protein, partial [Plesiomonas sp.]
SAAAALASQNAAKTSETNAKNSENIVVPLVPIVDQAAKDAAAASAQAASAAAAANQAVIDVKNLGAVPIGTVVEFISGKALPAGYLDGNGATFDELTYPDLKTYLGSNKLPNLYGGEDFLGKMIWVNHRSKIPANYVGADGQSIPTADAPAMKEAVANAAGIWSITEAAWQADPYSRGAFSTGDSTYFRMPDINGKSSGSVGSLFIRGDGKDAGSWSGMIQGDAIRNITGYFVADSIGVSPVGDAGGAITTTVATVYNVATGGSGNALYRHSFDASRVVPTANENRPKSVTGVWCICIKVPTIRAIKAAGVLSNEGMAQIDGVLNRVSALEALNVNKVTSLGAGVDLNTITAAGFYGQSSNTDAASGANYPTTKAGTLIVQVAGGTITTQLYIDYNTNEVHVRSCYNGTWQPWSRMYSSRNMTFEF